MWPHLVRAHHLSLKTVGLHATPRVDRCPVLSQILRPHKINAFSLFTLSKILGHFEHHFASYSLSFIYHYGTLCVKKKMTPLTKQKFCLCTWIQSGSSEWEIEVQKIKEFQDTILKAWARPEMDTRDSDLPAFADTLLALSYKQIVIWN